MAYSARSAVALLSAYLVALVAGYAAFLVVSDEARQACLQRQLSASPARADQICGRQQ